MYKLYFCNSFYSVPDCQAEPEALLLNTQDIYTSNELVLLAAQILVKENKLFNKFILVYQNREFTINSAGRFHKALPITSVWDNLIERL